MLVETKGIGDEKQTNTKEKKMKNKIKNYQEKRLFEI